MIAQKPVLFSQSALRPSGASLVVLSVSVPQYSRSRNVGPSSASSVSLPGLAVEGVVAVVAVDLIVASGAVDDVGRAVAGQGVVPASAAQALDVGADVVEFAGLAVVGAVADRDRQRRGPWVVGEIGAAVALQGVGAGAALQCVVGRAALQRVGAVAALQAVGAAATAERVATAPDRSACSRCRLR